MMGRKIGPALAVVGATAALGLGLASTARGDTGFYGPTPDEQTLTPDEQANVERMYLGFLREHHIYWAGTDDDLIQTGRAVCDDLGPRYHMTRDYVEGLVMGDELAGGPGAPMPQGNMPLFVMLTVPNLCPSVDGHHYVYPFKHDGPPN